MNRPLHGDSRPRHGRYDVPMVRIEPARIHDLPGAYRTAMLTADAGRDASHLHRDPDLLGHVYVGPYIAQGAGTRLVVVDESGSAGYLLSIDDTLAFEAWAEAAWWPPLRTRYRRLDDGSPDAELISHIHEPPPTPPEMADLYPAHLHIDLQERVRGLGLGRTLIERLLSDLRERRVRGVHLGVDGANVNAIGFYEHLGFREVRREPWGVVMGLRLDP